MPVGSATRLLHLRLQLKRIVTVRELARSQGFSDDFVFYSLNGDVNTVSPRFSPRRTAPRSLVHSFTHSLTQPRTPPSLQMLRQIGNAVPLPVGAALGRELKAAMLKKWQQDREDVTYVE